jgi:hypothetical protein
MVDGQVVARGGSSFATTDAPGVDRAARRIRAAMGW